MRTRLAAPALAGLLLASPLAQADENLLGYVRGAETIPGGGSELYFKLTQRDDKGQGDYTAYDAEIEYEYGVSDRFNVSGAVKALALDTDGSSSTATCPARATSASGPRALSYPASTTGCARPPTGWG